MRINVPFCPTRIGPRVQLTWTQVDTAAVVGGAITQGLTVFGGQVVYLLGGLGIAPRPSGTWVRKSSDGTTWTDVSVAAGAAGNNNAGASEPRFALRSATTLTLLVVTGTLNQYALYETTDLVTWTQRYGAVFGFIGAALGNGLAVVRAQNGRMYMFGNRGVGGIDVVEDTGAAYLARASGPSNNDNTAGRRWVAAGHNVIYVADSTALRTYNPATNTWANPHTAPAAIRGLVFHAGRSLLYFILADGRTFSYDGATVTQLAIGDSRFSPVSHFPQLVDGEANWYVATIAEPNAGYGDRPRLYRIIDDVAAIMLGSFDPAGAGLPVADPCGVVYHTPTSRFYMIWYDGTNNLCRMGRSGAVSLVS